MSDQNRPVAAALLTLIILQTIMLAALYAKIPPHPPEATPLFGIAPFIGAALAAAGSALFLKGIETRAGQILCLLAALLAAVSFGPQKYFDAQFPLIWPAVLTGQIAIVTILYNLAKAMVGFAKGSANHPA